MTFPLVLENDDGLRGGNVCLYCKQKIGQPHGPDCVTIVRRWKVRHIFEIEVDEPAGWDAEKVRFMNNESSRCADNSIDLIYAYARRQAAGTGIEDPCLCACHTCEVVEITDPTPRRAKESK